MSAHRNDRTAGRRLAAILAADVVGYSRMIAADEDGTLARLRDLFRTVVQPAMAAQRGRIFKLMGDAFLAEFPSAVGAVLCAAALQEAMARGAAASGVLLRIGVHLGDVVIEGSDLLGDGVNIAARLESLAEPGGIVVSGALAEQVRGRVPFDLHDLGERPLKNIDRPVRAFRLAVQGAGAAQPVPQADPPHPALPDRPSLVVLPFQNMGGDMEQEYFADGVVEDITTALSRMRWLFVIARNSAFTYKGRAVDVRQVGRELGVRYVLEGSVRRAGGRIRITGQLIEAETGHHIWADRLDGDATDVFALQDRVTEAIAGAIEPSLRSAEIERARRTTTASPDAYDLYLRALPLFHTLSEPNSKAALDLLRQASARDASYARAKALAATVHAFRFASWWGDEDAEVAEGMRLARAVLEGGDQDDPETLRHAGYTLSYVGREHETALAVIERALRLGGEGSAPVLSMAGRVRYNMGDWQASVAHLERARRLSPLDAEMSFILSGISMAYFVGGRYDDSADFAQQAIRLRPRLATAHRQRVTALANAGQLQEARDACPLLLEVLGPRYSIASNRRRLPFRDTSITDRFLEGLRLAGVPE